MLTDELEELRGSLAELYDLEREIGRGGMATVFLARDRRNDRVVGIKVLAADQSASLGAERFLREVKLATRLSHPNILPVYDSGSANGLLWYAMPFVDGESLRARMDRERELAIEDAVSIVCEVADALTYAHAQGIVHRDVKPENILLHGGHAVLADFGIARPTHSGATRLTGTGVSIGTAGYMSPEQATGDVVDARADVYSLACVLYEALVGQPPFTGPTIQAIMARAITEPPPSIRVVRAAVPEEIESAVMRALEKVPADRFQTASAFKAALLGEAATPYASRTLRFTAVRHAQQRRSQWKRLSVGAGAIGLAAMAGVIAARQARWIGARPAGEANLKRVGVLYFDDGSRDGSLRGIADGLTENLTDRLAAVGALDVISSNGVRPYRGRDVAIDSVARALHAGLLVAGEVKPAARGVDVRVTLADGASGEKLRSVAFHHDSSALNTIESDAADRVGQFLREQIGDEVRLRGERNSTSNAQAWLFVVRAAKRRKDADSLLDARELDGATAALRDADSLLTGAERMDPRWAVAPAQRAFTALRLAALLRNAPAQAAPVIDAGLLHAQRALALAPNDAEALEAKGTLLWDRFDYHLLVDPAAAARTLAQAESTLKAAVDIDRTRAGAWVALGALYYRRPDLALAMEAFRNAYAADAYLSSARDILSRLASTAYNQELYPDARRWCDLGRQRFPSDPVFAKCRLSLYTGRGEKPDADSVWYWERRYLALTPPAARAHASLEARLYAAGGLARAGLADSARHVIAAVLQEDTPIVDPHRDAPPIAAFVYVMLGDQDKAVDELRDALTVNPEHRKGLATRVGWWWRDLQSNPRFKELIAGAR